MACGIFVLTALFGFFSPSSLGNATTPLTFSHAFPVPFIPSRGDKTITFTDLTALATIRIFTATGELVQTLEETDGDGLYVWDGKSGDGNDLASGVYLYVIEGDSDEKKGKLIIVR